MKTEALAHRNWDDMVFENRHKEYGAYSIRQAYSRNVAIGFAITATAALLVIILPRLLPSASAENVLPEKKVRALEIQPQIYRIEEKKVVPKVAAAKRSDNLAVRVTHDEVTKPTPTVEEQSQALSSITTDEGDGAVGFSDGGDVGVPDAPVEQIVTTPKVFDIVEQMPAYEGGMEAMARFISRNIKYPAAAKRIDVQGTVFVSFIINYAGKVTEVKVIRGIMTECDNEAARVIGAMPGWKAGIQNGIPVSVRMVLPIKFSLNQ